jgi:hypothetical protein
MPVLVPAQLLPPEILAEIYHHLRSTGTSIAQRQGVAAPFSRVCRAFCHAQKLARVSEVALSGRARLECFTRWGSSAVSSVRSLEVIGTEDDLELMEHLIRRVKGSMVELQIEVVRQTQEAGMGEVMAATDALQEQLQGCIFLERVMLASPRGIQVFTGSKLEW